MQQRISIALVSILTAGVASQMLKALWVYSLLPQGVILIAVFMMLVGGATAWSYWLRYLRRKQLQEARLMQRQTKDLSYFVQEELIERQLDLTDESKRDMQTYLLRFDQGIPLGMAMIGVLLGLFN